MVDGVVSSGTNDVQTEELAGKISENAELHIRVSHPDITSLYILVSFSGLPLFECDVVLLCLTDVA